MSHGELACPFGNPVTNLVQSAFLQDAFTFPGLWWLYCIVLIINIFLLETFYLIRQKKSFSLLAGILSILVIMSLFFFPRHVLSPLEPENTRVLNMIIIQPNTPLEIKWDPGMNDYMVEEMIQLARQHTVDGAELRKPGSLLLIPETSFFNTDYRDVHSIPETLVEFCREKKWYMLGGAMIRYTENQRLQFYNSALFYDPFQEETDHYHKLRPVPFVESFPWSHRFPILQQLYEFIAAFDRGDRYSIFEVEGVRIAPLICFESTLFGLTRSFRKKGADIFITLTNDSWFDHTAGLDQHFIFAKAQALTHRVPFIQVANSGITAIISSGGEVIADIPPYSENVLIHQVEVPTGTSDQAGVPPSFLFPLSIVLALGGLLWNKYKTIHSKSLRKRS